MKNISQAMIPTFGHRTHNRALLFAVAAVLTGCGRDNGLHAPPVYDAAVGGNVGVGSGGAGGAMVGTSGGGGIAGSGMAGAMAQGGGSGTIQDGAVNDGMVSIDAICDFLQFWEDVRIATCDYAIYCYPISDSSTGKNPEFPKYYLVMDDEGRVDYASTDPTGFPRYKVFAAPCPSYAGQTIQYECVPML